MDDAQLANNYGSGIKRYILINQRLKGVILHPNKHVYVHKYNKMAADRGTNFST